VGWEEIFNRQVMLRSFSVKRRDYGDHYAEL
jgi:hypothetical protein